MKKLSLLTAAMLCCSLAFAQEAEGDQILLVPRLDLNLYQPLSSDGMSGFSLGSTSFYTLIEGNIGDSDFSYSISNHWLSKEPEQLYSNTFHSDETNWLDWAYLSYQAGQFDFSLGKQVLSIGTFEIDEYDFNSYTDLSSSLWNNLQVYQWAAKAGWTSSSENTSLAFQFATSPYGEKPLSSKLFSYSLYGTGDYGLYSGIWSFNAVQYDAESYAFYLALGNKLTVNDFDICLDYVARGFGGNLFDEVGFVGSVAWNPGEKFSLKVKGGLEYCNGDQDVAGYLPEDDELHDYYVPASLFAIHENGTSYAFGGLAAEYRYNEKLRLHAVAAYNNWSESLSLNVGVTYFFNLKAAFGK